MESVPETGVDSTAEESPEGAAGVDGSTRTLSSQAELSLTRFGKESMLGNYEIWKRMLRRLLDTMKKQIRNAELGDEFTLTFE